MRIAEIFESIQGEGQFEGTPSVFIRTTGCNLRCWFCDTAYTSWEPEGTFAPWERILEQSRAFGPEHVVITGGEPLLQPEVVPLTRALRDAGHFVTIETAGTVDRPVHAGLMSVSPKLANSTPQHGGRWRERHVRLRDRPEVVARFLRDYPCQLKFVIDRPEDVADVVRYVARFPDVSAGQVWLMPQGTTAAALCEKQLWLEPWARRYGYRVSGRLHIELFGNVRGT